MSALAREGAGGRGLDVRRLVLGVALPVGACALLIALFLAQPYRILYVTTPSIPTGWYVMKQIAPDHELSASDSIAYRPVIPEWARGRGIVNESVVFAKRVGALPGAWLQTHEHTHFACESRAHARDPLRHCRALGRMLSHDIQGQEIPDLPAFEALEIKPGFLYVTAEHPRSFDSRYQGLIPRERVVGLIYGPLW
ncbi:S26 family signal peptidase [Thioalkalivibrio thiocyanodenitrificans]|uniref:S26 family signal peptidase n=1 Tax=Thioalkalivibrio thiocyanodenitrificans TaxID=243063 RepID=UPI000381526D|nr:S26 family signal peptidase [Thioalkalivibrio thiocyanodenitrificans]